MTAILLVPPTTPALGKDYRPTHRIDLLGTLQKPPRVRFNAVQVQKAIAGLTLRIPAVITAAVSVRQKW